jgi:hypothetical protein
MHRQSICDHKYPICCVHKHLHASIFTFIYSHDLLFIHVLNCIYIFIYIHPYSSLFNYDHSHIHLHPCIQLCLSTLSTFIFQWLSSTFIHIIYVHPQFIYIQLHPPLYPPLIHVQFAVHTWSTNMLWTSLALEFVFKQPFYSSFQAACLAAWFVIVFGGH